MRMNIDSDTLLEKVARGMWAAFVAVQPHPEDWPRWDELLAQGHQGMHRVNEFRGYARDALRAQECRAGRGTTKLSRSPTTNY